MQLEHAEHTLETIRTLMERSQRYEHISGHSGLVAGAVCCCAAAEPKGPSAPSYRRAGSPGTARIRGPAPGAPRLFSQVFHGD